MLVLRLFRQGVLTQICGNDFTVLKVAPPFVASAEPVDAFVDAVEPGRRGPALLAHVPG